MTTDNPRKPLFLSQQETSLGVIAGVIIPALWIWADTSSRSGLGTFPVLAPGLSHHLIAVVTQSVAAIFMVAWLIRRRSPIQTAVSLGAFASAAIVSLWIPIVWSGVSLFVLILPAAIGLVYAWYAIRAGAWLLQGAGAEGLLMAAVVVAAVLLVGPYLIEGSVNADVDEAITILRSGPDGRVAEAKATLDGAFHYPYRRAVIAGLSDACSAETNPQALARLAHIQMSLNVQQFLLPATGST